jgi:hypothetical protein
MFSLMLGAPNMPAASAIAPGAVIVAAMPRPATICKIPIP